MKVFEAMILLIAMFSGIAAVAWLFLFRPEQVVKFHATMLRSFHKDLMNTSDEALDKGLQLPSDRLLVGRQSGYVNQGAKHPEKYPNFLLSIRLLGCLILSMLLVTIALLIFGILSGKQITVNIP